MDKKQQLVNWMRITLREAVWAPLSIIAFYMIGLALHLYDLSPPLDLPSHLLGGVAITYFFPFSYQKFAKLGGEYSHTHPVHLRFYLHRDDHHLLGILREPAGSIFWYTHGART